MTAQTQAGIYLTRTNKLTNRLGIGRSAHYEKISQGLWVPPIKISVRAAAYPSNETEALISAQVAGKTDDEIRVLVKYLVESRKKDPLAVYFASGKTPDEIKSTIKQLRDHLEIIGEAV